VGIIDKAKFWKKEEPDLGLPPATPQQYDYGAQGYQMPHTDPLQQQPMAEPDPFAQQSFQQYPPSTPFPGSPKTEQYAEHTEHSIHPRDVELILAKLDSIKSELDALHLRVRKIEQATEVQQTQKKYW
jgi:hypothetical protein